MFFPGCLKLWCAVGCFHHFQSCLDIAIIGTGHFMASHVVPPWSPLTSRPQSVGLKLYFRMTFEWWHFAIKLLVLWICHNNRFFFFFPVSHRKIYWSKMMWRWTKMGSQISIFNMPFPCLSVTYQKVDGGKWWKRKESKMSQKVRIKGNLTFSGISWRIWKKCI